ncbi:unnamed protein product [Lactuca saligna]|uniref:GRF-type domain-containing protein n=1 Tax=Lactuca saligna TaxID=75948 RepID=A0AA36EL57_LACSI|nr:unnamed protein product [Lactuca saligna]
MASSSSSYSSKRQDEFQVDHPCDCDLPSRVKISRTPDNPGRKFRVCQNSMNGKSSSCKFWQWLYANEGRTDERSPYRRKPKENHNLTLKICTLENEINICRMKIEQENNTNLVSFFSFPIELEMQVLIAYTPLPLDIELLPILGYLVQLDLEVHQALHILDLYLVLELQLQPGIQQDLQLQPDIHLLELQLQHVLQL